VNAHHQQFLRRLLLVTSVAVLSTPAAVSGQAGGPGFLFGRPTFSIGIKGGYAVPRAGSEIFDFARDQLTLDTGDFASSAWGAEIAVRTTERLDIAAGLGVSRSSARSEFQHWVDESDLPIEQTTTFLRVPMTLNAKWYFRDRGRSVSRFVWVPESWSPYVGVGGGAVWYRFEQEGDFVDFETLDVFSAFLESDGTTGTVHVFSGVDLSLGSKVVLTGEGRYSWASAEMGRDFVDFSDIDLGGFQATVGLSLRF